MPHHYRSCAMGALQDVLLDATRISHVQWMPIMLFVMMPPSSPLMCKGCPSRYPSGCHSHRSRTMDAMHAVHHDAPHYHPSCAKDVLPLVCQGCHSRCPSGCHSHRSCAMDALHVVLHDAPIITAHVPTMPFWMPLALLMCNGCLSCCSS